MPDTHCLPSGATGTDELTVPQISLGTMQQQVPAGLKRGVVVLCHGLFASPQAVPYVLQNYLATAYQTLATGLTGDGWVVIFPPFTEDFVNLPSPPQSPSLAIQNDITNDAGNGTRYVTGTLHLWDHIVDWIHTNYGPWPIVPFGISWGGYHAYQVAVNRTSDIIAYGGHCAATNLNHVSSVFTAPANWTSINSTGANIGSTFLNGMLTTPGFIGWSSTDVVVGTTDLPALISAAQTAGAPVTTLEDTTNNHGLYATDIGPGGTGFTGTTILDWFAGPVDALAPKVH